MQTLLNTLVCRAAAGMLACAMAGSAGASNAVVDYALSLLGIPYRNGGTTPREGFDCSGYVGHVYRRVAGIELPRTAHDMSRVGRAVGRHELERGDLVFFNTLGAKFSHVGIYIGGGRFVHSPKRGKVVSIVELDNVYWTRQFNGARRVLDAAQFAAGPKEAARKSAAVAPPRPVAAARHVETRDARRRAHGRPVPRVVAGASSWERVGEN
jgi:NlpC/P60 family